MIKRQTKKTKSQKQTTAQNKRKSPRKAPVAEDLTFLEHVYELRARLFWITISLVVTSAIGFQYKDFLVAFVIAPLHGEKLVYLTPGGGFSFIFTICLYFGALVTIPVIMYHIYRFLQPVLGTTSRRFIAFVLLLSSLLAASGAVFGYYVAVPAAIHFLSTFAGDAVMPNLTAESYLGFIVAYMLGLAALFQLPLLLFIIDHVRPFKPGTLLSSQRFVIVGAVIAAAVITPTPDAVNQMIVAGPIIFIYQLGAIAVFIRRKVGRRSLKKHAAQEVSRAAENVAHSEPVTEQRRQPAMAQAISKPQSSHMSVNMSVSASHLQPAPKPVHRSIDGFSRQRPSRVSLTVPARSLPQNNALAVTSSRDPSVSSSQAGGRQVRSLDGFSLI